MKTHLLMMRMKTNELNFMKTFLGTLQFIVFLYYCLILWCESEFDYKIVLISAALTVLWIVSLNKVSEKTNDFIGCLLGILLIGSFVFVYIYMIANLKSLLVGSIPVITVYTIILRIKKQIRKKREKQNAFNAKDDK